MNKAREVAEEWKRIKTIEKTNLMLDNSKCPLKAGDCKSLV